MSRVDHFTYLDTPGTAPSSKKVKNLNLPELVQREYALWDNLEERRTICGPDIDNITENTYRSECGYPTRYIYQSNLFQFFEDSNIIQNTINHPTYDGTITAQKGQKYSVEYTPTEIAYEIYNEAALIQGKLNPDPEQ